MAIHLLVPLDNSSFCQAAGQVAMQIAAAQPSRITALRVVNVRPSSGNILDDLAGNLGFEPAVVPAEVARERDNEATAMVVDWSQKARARGLEVHGKVEVGGVANVIRTEAEAADLVVMGLRGETEERHPRQGGQMIAWLPTHVDVPILWAAPGSAPLTSIAIGYDGSEGALHAVSALRHFLVPLGLTIHAIYVSEDGSDPDRILDQLDDHLPSATVEKHVVTGTSPHETLVAQCHALGCGLLVLGFAGHGGVRDLLFGNATEHILLQGTLSVLVAR